MIVLKLYSWELSQADFKAIADLLRDHYGIFIYYLPLSADQLLGNQAELLISEKPLSPRTKKPSLLFRDC